MPRTDRKTTPAPAREPVTAPKRARASSSTTLPTPGPDDAADALRALAGQLASAADAYNRRLKAEAPQLDSGAIYARLQEEQRLRGMANQLYFEAVDRTLADAAGDQKGVAAAVAQALDRLTSAATFAAALDLVGDLLALAAAILSRKPTTVVAALEALKQDVTLSTATAAVR